MTGIGRPLGVFDSFTKHETELTVKLHETTLVSRDNFAVKTLDDQIFLNINGPALSLHSKKTVYDAQGTPIMNIRNKVLSLRRGFRIYQGEGEEHEVIHVRGHYSFGGSKMTVTFTNFDGESIELEIKGDWLVRKAKIFWKEVPVATISRQFFNGGLFVSDSARYFLTAAPGVDIAMLVAACVCLDEQEYDGI